MLLKKIKKLKNLHKGILNKIPMFLIVAILLSSCIPQKKILYLQDKEEGTVKNEFTTPVQQHKIKTGDDLYIRVLSLDEKTAKVFNSMGGDNQNNMNIQYGGAYLMSFAVSDSGYIDFPYIGKIAVEGLTINEAKMLLQKELSEYLKYITVVIKLVNFKVSVLGEVMHPGHFDIFNDRVTVFEVIGMAGDLTPYGKRNNVALIRQTENGSEIHYLDLTDKKLLQSEYFYLMPNDVIYVSQMASKPFGLANFKLNEFVSILSSIVSLILLINYTK